MYCQTKAAPRPTGREWSGRASAIGRGWAGGRPRRGPHIRSGPAAPRRRPGWCASGPPLLEEASKSDCVARFSGWKRPRQQADRPLTRLAAEPVPHRAPGMFVVSNSAGMSSGPLASRIASASKALIRGRELLAESEEFLVVGRFGACQPQPGHTARGNVSESIFGPPVGARSCSLK